MSNGCSYNITEETDDAKMRVVDSKTSSDIFTVTKNHVILIFVCHPKDAKLCCDVTNLSSIHISGHC